MTADSSRKRCVVVYATRERQHLWTVDLPPEATIADALAAARQIGLPAPAGIDESASIPWDTAPVGIFGEIRNRTDRPEDGDRIEIYRPLHSDPRERRRARVDRARKGR